MESVSQRGGLFGKLMGLILLGILCNYFIYSPIIHIPFHHHDTYKYSIGAPKLHCNQNPGNFANRSLSRFTSAYTDCKNFQYVNTLSKMQIARAITIFLIGICAGAFATWLTYQGLSYIYALIFSVFVFSLSALQTSVIMAAEFIPLTLLFSFIASLFCNKFISLSEINENRLKQLVYAVLSFLILLLAFFSYSPLSAFFLIPLFYLTINSSLDKWPALRKRIAIAGLFFVACSLIFFFVAKHHMLVKGQVGVGAYRYDKINLNIIPRIPLAITLMLKQSNINTNFVQILLAESVIVIASLIFIYHLFKDYLRSTNKTDFIFFIVQKILAILILLGLGSEVFLLLAEPVVFGRVVYVMQVMGAILVIWAVSFLIYQFVNIDKAEKITTFAIASLLIINTFIIHYNITASALNDKLELNYITSKLADYISTKGLPDRVHIISSSEENFNGQAKIDDIYSVNSTYYAGDIGSIVYTAVLQLTDKKNIAYYPQCIFSENGEEAFFDREKKCITNKFKKPINSVIVTFSRPGKPIYHTNNMLEIDMNKLNLLLEKNRKVID